MKDSEYSKATEQFPFFTGLSQEAQTASKQELTTVSYEPGIILLEEGHVCRNLFFILEGTIRVYKLSPDGREVTLYRMTRGETCLITASCMLHGQPFNAVAETETAVRALSVPHRFLQTHLFQDFSFMQFLFGNTFSRFQDVMDAFSRITFDSLHQRIATAVYQRASETGFPPTVYFTHEQLAVEIGSSREVVSRALKKPLFASILTGGRGKIRIHDYEKLRRLSGS
ncbi:Crp/Fnr family transcriptional regulator [Salisediminibacterium selenitireducens]|uniref:Transcriptional regulator, Crp/Fnr family n=1 Tax=Bacillus selenitireducens (strain ATCC 700615 / DSM 15326 / MLS10) TaxID=439292 RepID=D6XZ55_BACIE|nr:Crp/Fnr family transcriptional regulator [Salisediminibacterium selenitireducens]ADI00340.1 putative transcriptional regulator, Crp/Fnr family [[Bacillus] selenitireducens MLS10]